jgi:hypothetical protein
MVFGMNCADASIAIWDPSKGFTHLESSEAQTFVNYSPECNTWEQQKQDYEPNIFGFRVAKEATMVGFSDGVTDCIYVDEKGKNPGQVKREQLSLLNEVVRNPIFDQEVEEKLPPTESQVKEMIRAGVIQDTVISPLEITTRLLHHSQWKTSENSDKNRKLYAIANVENRDATPQNRAIHLIFPKGETIPAELWGALSLENQKKFTKTDLGNYVCETDKVSEGFIAMKRSTWNEKFAKSHTELGIPVDPENFPDHEKASEEVERLTKSKTLDNFVFLSSDRINDSYVILRKRDTEGRLLEDGRKSDDVVVAVAP